MLIYNFSSFTVFPFRAPEFCPYNMNLQEYDLFQLFFSFLPISEKIRLKIQSHFIIYSICEHKHYKNQ